ncbi:hypothetical protein M8818_003883 [Zalaria obscura]|uniref:Uncharacterized protein n=1 Tax=Zalaria obscura TaxID=2024903 RepID=A0ACC3SDP3_9PEZI
MASNPTSTSDSQSLYDLLGTELPAGHRFTFHHVSTPPTKCDPLFAPPPGQKPEITFCESQFLTASITTPNNAAGQAVIVFAIEILIYTTKRLTTIFVAKADSTGHLTELQLPRSQASPVRTIASVYISWLVERRQRPGKRLVVSLFARAQDQYLFPGSVDNKGKHVLNDRQLVKWWCKTLDPVLRQEPKETVGENGQFDKDTTASRGYVIVPGFDRNETTTFFPSSWRADPPDKRRWQYGHPLEEIAANPAAPPRCLVPRFPDDPKARYLDELDEELPDTSHSQTQSSPTKRGSGVWRSIKTLDQFWETMAFRQECSSGRLVGFVWIVFTPSDFDDCLDSGDSSAQHSVLPPLSNGHDLPSLDERIPRKQTRRKKLTGPVITRQPRVKTSSSAHSAGLGPEGSVYFKWPESSRGQIVLDEAAYTRTHDLLLRLDFATLGAAMESSHKWFEEVHLTAGRPGVWGKAIEGSHQDVHAITGTPAGLSNEK